MEVLVFIIIWLALCIAVGFYAEGKGRSGVGIFFLSLLLSPLVGLVAALAMHPNEKKVAAAEGKKRCPECAEYIKPDARICRFCQYKFPELTELEQLKASGIAAGPACPKCGSVNTFSRNDQATASRWWRVAEILRFHCRKCGEAWQAGKSAPIETTNIGLLVSLGFVALTVLLLVVALTRPQTKDEKQQGMAPPSAQAQSPLATPAQSSQNNWRLDESTNSMDGVKTTVLRDECGDHSIFIRFKGRQLEAYVTTPEMVGHDDTAVRVRFDAGKPISQDWSRSEDYHALFSPSPRWLVTKLQASKKFHIEYHPYEKVPETLSFDVAGLVVPKALLDAYDKQHQQERAASQKRFDACMEEQRQSSLASVETEADRENYCKAATQ